MRPGTAKELSRDFNLFGKVPPNASELEEAVLGAIMLEGKAFMQVAGFLKAVHFYLPQHELIYSACVNLFARNSPIDLLTVVEELKKSGSLEQVGGAYYVSQLTNKVASSAHIEHHARTIKEKYIRREIIRIGQKFTRDSYDESIDELELLSDAMTEYGNLMNDVAGGSFQSFKDAITERVAEIGEARNKPEESRYVLGKPTGIYSLDRKISGYCKTNLIIIAARPGQGKTTLMLEGVYQNIIQDIPTGVFSIEMSFKELIDRLISRHLKIDSKKIRNGNLTNEEFEQVEIARDYLKSRPLYVNERTSDLQGITAISKGWCAQHGVEEIYVDYIQLVRVAEKKTINSREQEVSKVSSTLKLLAKELNIPVIALAQLNRSAEMRGGDKRPQLSDLRESGAIEQDADCVIFLYSPAEYGIMNYDDGTSTEKVTELKVCKNRHGDTCTVLTHYYREINHFDDSQFSNYKFGYKNEKQSEVNSWIDKQHEKSKAASGDNFTKKEPVIDDFDDF